MAWYNAKKEPEYKISEEMGRAAVLEFVSFYDVEFGDKPDKNFDGLMDDLVKYYRMGLLENRKDDNLGFCVVQHLKSGQDLTYREMKGSDRLVADRFDVKTEVNEKVNAILGKLSGLGDDAIMKLMRDDRRAALLVATIFFGV
jgi:hypothetical protein